MCPESITLPTDYDSDNTTVTFSMDVMDNVDSMPTVSCMPASGSVFEFGETYVTCMVGDESGNMDNCTFLVNITGM